MKTIALGFFATVIAASCAMAGDEAAAKEYKQPVTAPCFQDQEFQLDLFGSYTGMRYANGDWREDHRGSNNRDGAGGGMGLNFFFVRYFGIGVDGDVSSNRNGLWDVTAKLIARYPVQLGSCCVAPYIFTGGGMQTDGFTTGAYMVGGGLEWRATQRVGVFGEGRYTWSGHDHEDDNAQARLGLRVAF